MGAVDSWGMPAVVWGPVDPRTTLEDEVVLVVRAGGSRRMARAALVADAAMVVAVRVVAQAVRRLHLDQ